MFRTLSIMENNTSNFLPHHPIIHTGTKQIEFGGGENLVDKAKHKLWHQTDWNQSRSATY